MLRQAELIRDGYTYQVRHFVAWARETGHGIDEDGLRGYFEHLDVSTYSANTIRNKRSAVKRRVRQIFHDAPIEDRVRIDRVLSDLDHDDPAPKINSVQVTRDRILDAGEYRELLIRCRSARQRAFIKFLNATGCRVSEMIGVRLDQVEELGTSFKVRVLGKGKKERFVRIPAALFAEIRETFHGENYLFETATRRPYTRGYVSAQIAKIGKMIGRRISAHSLRHCFATRKVQQLPGKLDAVSRYLGHSSPSITLAMYCHSSLSDAELFDEDLEAVL
jgi:integrase/recombinase XerD